ncbi:MAG TPA: ABC transporter permease [Longimicrobiales bacterium]|nr:ABC transporter permease [Longimicrobiales bacterium]
MLAVTRSVRHAARRLLRAPVFAAASILTLTFGIGAATGVFSLVDGVLLRPLPYAAPDRLVDLSHTLALSGVARVDQSDATYLYYRRESHVFTDIAAYQAAAVNLASPSGDAASAERVAAARVSAGLFRVLGVAPSRGRAFLESEDGPGAAPVALIGERLWKRKYGGDPGIVGRRLEIDGVSREVIGIVPASFRFPAAGTELWLPVGIDPARTESAIFDYRAVARLRPGVTAAAAAAELQRLLPRVPEAFAGRLTAAAIAQIKMRAVVRPLRDVVVGDVGPALWVVLGSVGFVLLAACANVANLFLVRAEGRRRELAVRRALGAGRGRIVAEFLSEGLVLAAAGGALGVAAAAAGVRVLRSLEAGISIPRLDEIGVDGVALGVAAGLTLLAALLVSALPALRSARLAVSAALNEASRSATAGRRQTRAQHVLIVAQVALALVLLAGAGLMARSFARLRAVQPGFDAAHALTFRIALPDAAYPVPDDAARLLVRALDEIAALPGVQAAGAVTKLPLADEARRDTAVFIEGQPPATGIPNVHQVAYASPGYFRALGIPLVAGRAFERPDPGHARLEVIVSRALADRYWRGDAVGKRVRLMPQGPWLTIVGVAGNVRGTALDQPPDETVYLPLVSAGAAAAGDAPGDPRWAPHDAAFVVRGAGDATRLAARIAAVVRGLDPAVPVYGVRPMTEVVAGAAARTSFTLLLLGIASAVALALGAVGIYGVISYVVSLRAREIAVRLALGARPAHVRRMVARQAVAVGAVGIALGLVAALATTRFMATLLFGVAPTDPATLAGAAALLLAVALAASWLPARRAAATDPARALRAE